jgi:flavodoxin
VVEKTETKETKKVAKMMVKEMTEKVAKTEKTEAQRFTSKILEQKKNGLSRIPLWLACL